MTQVFGRGGPLFKMMVNITCNTEVGDQKPGAIISVSRAERARLKYKGWADDVVEESKATTVTRAERAAQTKEQKKSGATGRAKSKSTAAKKSAKKSTKGGRRGTAANRKVSDGATR